MQPPKKIIELADKIDDKTLDNLEAKLKSLQKKTIHLIIRLLKGIKGIAGTILMYMLLSWLFLNIYDSLGFEKTIIILLVGLINFYLRKPK